MIEKPACGIDKYYLRKDIIDGHDLEIYVYGFELMLSTLCNVSPVFAATGRKRAKIRT